MGITSRGTIAAVVGEASCVPCVAATFRAPPLLSSPLLSSPLISSYPCPATAPAAFSLSTFVYCSTFLHSIHTAATFPFPSSGLGVPYRLSLSHSSSSSSCSFIPLPRSLLFICLLPFLIYILELREREGKNEGKPINCPGGLSIDRPQAPCVVYLIEWHNYTHTHPHTHTPTLTPAHTHTSRAFII